MRHRPPRLLDASAIVALFEGDQKADRLLNQADQGLIHLLLPTTAIADAEQAVRAGPNGWESILLTDGVRSLTLSEHAAIEIGTWPGSLAARHAAHEARALRAAVVTQIRGPTRGCRGTCE